MRKNTRRVLALVMALALILGNFTGLGTTSKAAGISEIFSVTTTVKEFSSQGGNVDIPSKVRILAAMCIIGSWLKVKVIHILARL